MKSEAAAPFERIMRLALGLARRAWARGEVPVGAVVVRGREVVGRGFNRTIGRHDPSAHAEIIALRQAARRLGNHRLTGCSLVVTLEPCVMCLGAAVQARVAAVVFGAADPKAGAVSSIWRFPFAKMNHRPEVRGGVLSSDCGQIVKDFFRARRRTGAGR